MEDLIAGQRRWSASSPSVAFAVTPRFFLRSFGDGFAGQLEERAGKKSQRRKSPFPPCNMLARPSVLYVNVLFPESEHQVWNDRGRFVWGVCGDDGRGTSTGREERRAKTGQVGWNRIGPRRALSGMSRMPITKDGREQVFKRTPSARGQHTPIEPKNENVHEEIDDAVSDEHARQVGDLPPVQHPSYA